MRKISITREREVTKLSLVEMQGTISVKQNENKFDLGEEPAPDLTEKVKVGVLSTTNDKEPTFTLGNQKLYGKHKKLKRKFAVLKKISETEYRLTAKIEEKISFVKRPLPI